MGPGRGDWGELGRGEGHPCHHQHPGDTPHVPPAQKRALTWACCRASQKMATEPRCPSSEVGLPHSVSWLPAAVVATTPSVGSWVGVQEWAPRVAGTDWERPSTGCCGKASSGPWGAGGCPVAVVAVVVVRWPAEPMQQEVKDWEGEGITSAPGEAVGRVWVGAGGIPHLVEGREAQLRRFPQVPVRVDADHVLAEGPAAGHVDDVHAVLGGTERDVRALRWP